MGDAKPIKVIYSSRAIESITNLSIYLANKGYPETASKFCQKLYNFGDSLGVIPNKYGICRFKNLSIFNLHCAVYKDWIFIHKTEDDRVIVMDIVHSSNLK